MARLFRLTAIFAFFLSTALFSFTYYFSTGTGKTIDSLNRTDLVAGDSVLFNRGDTFPGKVIIKASGSADKPIYYGAFGTGAKPVITGAVHIMEWSPLGSGLYSAPLSQRPVMVTYDGQPLVLARSPNKGFHAISTVVDSYFQFIDSSMINGADWTGATIHVRTSNWTIHTKKVASFDPAAGLFTVSQIPGFAYGYPLKAHWGYFINNHMSALDTAGEWFYDSLAQTLILRTPDNGNPAGHRILGAVLDYGFYSQRGAQYDYNIIDSLEILQYAVNGIEIAGSNNIIRNCSISFAEQRGIVFTSGGANQVVGNSVYGSNGLGIYMSCPNSLIERNSIQGIALFNRLNAYGIELGYAIFSNGADNFIRLNRLDSIGYIGILFDGVRHLVERNFITHACMTTDDGGGTYCANRNFPANQGVVGSVISENIVLYSQGSGAGSPEEGMRPANGIYLDDFAHDVTVTGNTAAFCSGWGYMLHNAVDCGITGNTAVGNGGSQLILQFDGIQYSDSMRNNRITGNLFCSTSDEQRTFLISSRDGRINLGTYDSNAYWNPFVDAPVSAPGGPYSLSSWQTFSGQDAASWESPVRWTNFRITDTIGPELIRNGGLDTNTSAWSIWSASGTSTIARDSGQGLDGGCLRVNCLGLTSNVVITGSFQLKQGGQYLLRFSVRGSKPGVIFPIIRNSVNYGTRGYAGQAAVDSIRRDFVALFTSTAIDTPCRLDFEGDVADSVYWLDNVSVREAEAEMLDTVERVVLCINPTEQDSQVQLEGGLFELDGTPAPRSVTLAPFRSAVYYRDLSGSSPVPDPTEVAKEAGITVAPNPFNPMVVVTLSGISGPVCTDIFTVNGRKIAAFTNFAREKQTMICWNAGHFPSGIYMVRIQSAQGAFIRAVTLLK